MKTHSQSLACLVLLIVSSAYAQQKPGADVPWTTYEAEEMKTDGIVLGPEYGPYKVETESSGQRCVKLGVKGQSVTFKALGEANSLVIRFSLPDGGHGNGTRSTLAIFLNGELRTTCEISSRYTMLYGKYPFTNDASEGKERNFYDEARVSDCQIKPGDTVKIQRADGGDDDASFCIVDLVDLENHPAPLKVPDNSVSLTDPQFGGPDGAGDFTEAFRKCLANAAETGKTVWIPQGIFTISGDIVLRQDTKIQGAGMWHSVLKGDENLYSTSNRRVRLRGNGSNIHLSDFAIVGKLNYRRDNEANDGIVGTYGENSTIRNLWIEHTKVGMWIENSKNLLVEGCRLRNTIADGINFCVGMTESTIRNCTARGTGDDCFAMWPATFGQQRYVPGKNLVTHCTGQLPFLANGAAIYGGDSNKVSDCLFTDISPGSAILISTTFPTENRQRGINNNFSGKTVVENCDVRTSGGFDHEWGWRAAVQICADKRTISGIEVSNVNIERSLSDGFSVISKSAGTQNGQLQNAELRNIRIGDFGIGEAGRHRLWIQEGTEGGLTISGTDIPGIVNESKNFSILSH